MNSSLIDDKSEEIATKIYNSLCELTLDIWKLFAANIYLSGGT